MTYPQRRKLRHEVGVYVASNRYFRMTWPRLRAIVPGIRGWLDSMPSLVHDEKPCGCKALGGGGSFYCKAEHMVAELSIGGES